MDYSRAVAPLRRLFRGGRRLAYGAYYAVNRLNHRRECYAPRKRVGDATFRSYELLLRHGDDVLLRRLLDACSAGDVVYDVGANTGTYSLSVAATHPDARVVAFEPDPTVCSQLEANVRVNGFSTVAVRCEGVADQTGTRTFYRSTYDELGSFRAANAAGWEARVRDAVDVPAVALDALVADGTVPPPDHLKVDVEGFGREVFAGGRDVLRRHRPYVYYEPHDGEDDDAVAELLTDAGYEVRTRPEGWVCTPADRSG
jgi:FkbM family methyltransferase